MEPEKHAVSSRPLKLKIQTRYSKNPCIRTLNFEDQAAVGSYLVITISNIRLLGSQKGFLIYKD